MHFQVPRLVARLASDDCATVISGDGDVGDVDEDAARWRRRWELGLEMREGEGMNALEASDRRDKRVTVSRSLPGLPEAHATRVTQCAFGITSRT